MSAGKHNDHYPESGFGWEEPAERLGEQLDDTATETRDDSAQEAYKEEDAVLLWTAAGMMAAVVGGFYVRRKFKHKD